MGTWGAGIMDNDGALDLLARTSAPLVKLIKKFFAKPPLKRNLDQGEDEVMPAFALLLKLDGRGIVHDFSSATLAQWRDEYKQLFERDVHLGQPKRNYVPDRRHNLARLWARLIRLARRGERRLEHRMTSVVS